MVVSLEPFAIYSGAPVSVTTLIALLVCLIPTTIGGLLSAIGIAGMDRMVQRNVLAMSGRAVEAAGDVDVLLLDKTGTITLGNRQATRFVPLRGVDEREVAQAAMPSSLADETPEGYLAFTSKIIRWLKYGQEASKHQEAALHRLEEHALLAEDLGAEVIRTKSKDIARTPGDGDRPGSAGTQSLGRTHPWFHHQSLVALQDRYQYSSRATVPG